MRIFIDYGIKYMKKLLRSKYIANGIAYHELVQVEYKFLCGFEISIFGQHSDPSSVCVFSRGCEPTRTFIKTMLIAGS